MTIFAFTHETLASRIHFGSGSVEDVSDEIARLGAERVLLIVSRSARRAAGRVSAALGGRLAAGVSEVRVHVPVALAEAAVRCAADVSADALVTVGGGSATGLGKAVAVRTGLPLVAVPTTYAGSECTPVYGVTGEHKETGRDARAQPAAVCYDPELTVGLPPRATAASGFNAMAHCVEAVGRDRPDPVAVLHAAAALPLLADALRRLAGWPDDLAARSDALYGAYLAGTALAAAGTGAHHRLCHVLGGDLGLPHADVHAALLPYTVALRPAAERDRIGRALGTDDPVAALRDLAAATGAPTSLAEAGMARDDAERVAGPAYGALLGIPGSTARPVDPATVRALLDDAYHGRRPA